MSHAGKSSLGSNSKDLLSYWKQETSGRTTAAAPIVTFKDLQEDKDSGEELELL